jgi:molecular chaperone GrpE
VHTNKEKKGPVTALAEHCSEMEQCCKTYKEDYLRALADFDNYRKRTERDAELSRRMALERLVMDLLPVLDNFDRAVGAAEGSKDIATIQKGMELIHRQLGEVLCRHGIEEYSCLGEEFDPRWAEAISFVHSDEHAPNTVVTETCKGYSCGEKVLRPAKVVVAKASGRGQKPEIRDQSAEVAQEGPEEISDEGGESNGEE